MVLLPAEIPVTTPELLMVATPVFDEIQGLTEAGVGDPLKVVVLFTQIVVLPLMVGRAFTVRGALAVVVPQVLVTANEIFCVPAVLYTMVPGLAVLADAGVPLVKVQL